MEPAEPDNPRPASASPARLFGHALRAFDRGRPVLVMGHFDADGLAAMAMFMRAFRLAGWRAEPRIVGRGENAWSDAMRQELAAADFGGLIVADLGTRSGDIAPHLPTVIVDHHVPQGFPERAVTITGIGETPIPTSSLLAWRAAAALGDVGPLLWLAALGIVGDMAEREAFPEMAAAKARYGMTALREAVSLINAARRSAAADARPALQLLLNAEGPKDITSGAHPETALLLAAREEVRQALEAARRIAPKVVGDVALIRFSSPCQVHPLVAQSWRGRLRNKIVIAANEGYTPDRVHFAARTAMDVDLIAFFARHRPPEADEQYGGGHRQASGGALRRAAWEALLGRLGFLPASEAA